MTSRPLSNVHHNERTQSYKTIDPHTKRNKNRDSESRTRINHQQVARAHGRALQETPYVPTDKPMETAPSAPRAHDHCRIPRREIHKHEAKG